MDTDATQLAVLNTTVNRMASDVREINDKLNQNYVTKSEIAPIKEKLDFIQRGFLWLVGIFTAGLVAAFLRVIGVIK